MNNEDMSDIMKNFSSLLEGKQLPENMQEILNNLKNSSENDIDNNSNTNSSSNNIDPEMVNNLINMFGNNSKENTNKTNNSNSSNIDIETIMKMKTIIDEINNTQNDPRANLLLSLKPYLKDSRKDKVEQYIKLLNMGKVARVFNINGGGKNK